MKRFDVVVDTKLRVESFSLLTQAKHFLLLNTLGFDVSDVTINLFSDNFLTHFNGFCALLQVNDFLVKNVNALTFYENVSATGNVSSYCKNCFTLTDLSTGNSVIWWGSVACLTNMVLYTSDPITNVRFLRTVSFALSQFKEAVTILQEVFPSNSDTLYNEIISVQSSRLQTGRGFFFSNELVLVKQLNDLVNVSVPLKDTGSLKLLNNVPFSNNYYVTPLPNYVFDVSYGAKRKDVKFSLVSKFLDVLEILLVDASGRFLCGLETLLTLWCEVNFNVFNVKFPSFPVDVPGSKIFEFTEILNVLCKDELFLSTDFFGESDEFSFNTVKFKNDVETAELLTVNK